MSTETQWSHWELRNPDGHARAIVELLPYGVAIRIPEDDHFTSEQARAIARELIAAADSADDFYRMHK